jgi:hypothetical protein
MTSEMKSFVERLVGHFPRLQPLLTEHLDDNFDELLPIVFFGDLTRLAETTTRAGGPNSLSSSSITWRNRSPPASLR